MRHALLTLLIIATPAMAGTHRARHQATPGGHVQAVSASLHVVRRGETAGRIAAVNHISLRQLQALNPGRNLARLSIGTKLHVAPRAAFREPLVGQPEAGATVVLAKGQTLYALAKANGVTLGNLMAVNPGLNPRRLRPGTVLHLPGDTPAQVAKADLGDLPAIPEAPGETPSGLARLPAIPASTLPMPREASLIPSGAPGADPLLPFRPADPDHLDLFWPVETRSISSYWGPRIRTRFLRVKHRRKKRIRYHSRHEGIDLPAPMHSDVYAALDGVVTYVGKERGYGNVVKLDDGNGVMTVYAHHSVNLVHEGEIVHRGEKIAEVGRTGNATGPHLHFELRVHGIPQNPLPVLDDTEEVPGELTAQGGTDGGPSVH